jgi:hypothetical protein
MVLAQAATRFRCVTGNVALRVKLAAIVLSEKEKEGS